jgi:hypothetical protein
MRTLQLMTATNLAKGKQTMTRDEIPFEPSHPAQQVDGYYFGPWAWEIVKHVGQNSFSVRLTYEDPDYVNDSTMVFPDEDLESLVDCIERLLERVGTKCGRQLRANAADGWVRLAPSSN